MKKLLLIAVAFIILTSSAFAGVEEGLKKLKRSAAIRAELEEIQKERKENCTVLSRKEIFELLDSAASQAELTSTLEKIKKCLPVEIRIRASLADLYFHAEEGKEYMALLKRGIKRYEQEIAELRKIPIPILSPEKTIEYWSGEASKETEEAMRPREKLEGKERLLQEAVNLLKSVRIFKSQKSFKNAIAALEKMDLRKEDQDDVRLNLASFEIHKIFGKNRFGFRHIAKFKKALAEAYIKEIREGVGLKRFWKSVRAFNEDTKLEIESIELIIEAHEEVFGPLNKRSKPKSAPKPLPPTPKPKGELIEC